MDSVPIFDCDRLATMEIGGVVYCNPTFREKLFPQEQYCFFAAFLSLCTEGRRTNLSIGRVQSLLSSPSWS